MPLDYAAIGCRLQARRKELGITQEKNKKMQAIIARRGFAYRGKLAGNRVAYDIDLAEKSE